MEKIMKQEGMSSGHCKAKVEDALGELPGTFATANPKDGTVNIVTDDTVTDQQLIDAITENTPFKVLSIA